LIVISALDTTSNKTLLDYISITQELFWTVILLPLQVKSSVTKGWNNLACEQAHVWELSASGAGTYVRGEATIVTASCEAARK